VNRGDDKGAKMKGNNIPEKGNEGEYERRDKREENFSI
jgi:hypothetical protein